MSECTAFNEDWSVRSRVLKVRAEGEVASDTTACVRCNKVGGIGINAELHVRGKEADDGALICCDVVKEAVAMFKGGFGWGGSGCSEGVEGGKKG